jgi:hypothetical protein
VNQGTIVGVRKTTEYPWQRKSGVVRPMPAATARPVARAATTTRTFPGIRARPPAQAPSFFAEVGDWFTALSTGAKMRLALVGCLLLLLLGIVAPATAITVVAQNLGNFLSPAPTQETPRNENRVTTAKTSGVQSLGDTENKVAMAKKTPTPTPVPPTPTPTPTVKPKAPVVSKPKPTAPPPTQSAPPAEPRPALVPVQWDSRLGPGGLPLLGNIGIDNAPVQSGQAFWRVTKVQFEDYNESNMNHNIYVTILDENGKRLEDQTIVIQYDDGGLKTERKGIGDQKPNGDYCNCNYDYPMYGAAYTVWIDGNTPSDKVHGMIMPMHRHVNYRVWFQRVVMP